MPQYYLPPEVAKFLANPPPPERPIHHWIFSAALRLHKCQLPPAEIENVIALAVTKVGRTRPAGEIAEAVRNSAPDKLNSKRRGAPKAKTSNPPAKKVSSSVLDDVLRQRVVNDSTLGGLEGLKCLSPMQSLDEKDARWYLGQLFPGDPLVCLGIDKTVCFTRHLSEFSEPLGFYQLVVPSPMSAPQGLTKNGKLSSRSLDNVGPRHYLVTEFDSGSFDEQAAIIEHLSKFAPLVMVVFSGKKSLHAWWTCKGESEEAVLRFFHYAEKLGADSPTKSPVQLCRLPEGTRDSKTAQCVYYFNPANVAGCGGKEAA